MMEAKKSHQSIKLTQVTTGILFLFVGIFFLLVLLFASLIPNAYLDKSIFVWIGISIFLILFIEISLYWISASLKIKEEKFKIENKNVFFQISHLTGLFFKYNSLIKSILSILVLLGVLLFSAFYFIKIIKVGGDSSFSTILYPNNYLSFLFLFPEVFFI